MAPFALEENIFVPMLPPTTTTDATAMDDNVPIVNAVPVTAATAQQRTGMMVVPIVQKDLSSHLSVVNPNEAIKELQQQGFSLGKYVVYANHSLEQSCHKSIFTLICAFLIFYPVLH